VAEQKASGQAAPAAGEAPAVAVARQLNEVARQAGKKLAFEAEPADFLATLERLAAPEARA
jgi:hypothetical protein